MGQTWEFSHVASIQTFTIPKSGKYRITCNAPKGGFGTYSDVGERESGGFGSSMSGVFIFEAGKILKIIVGSQGSDATTSTYDANNCDKTTGGAGGICGVFTNDLPLIIASGGKGGRDLSYMSKQQPSQKAPTVQLPRTDTTFPKSTDFSVLNPEAFSRTSNYTRGSYTVNTGYGALSSFTAMDDTCGINGVDGCNILPKTESNNAGVNLSPNGSVIIECIQEGGINIPNLDIKGIFIPEAFDRDFYDRVRFNTKGIILAYPTWVSHIAYSVSLSYGSISKSFNSSVIDDAKINLGIPYKPDAVNMYDNLKSVNIVIKPIAFSKYGTLKVPDIKLTFADIFKGVIADVGFSPNGHRISSSRDIVVKSNGLAFPPDFDKSRYCTSCSYIEGLVYQDTITIN